MSEIAQISLMKHMFLLDWLFEKFSEELIMRDIFWRQ